MANSMCLKSVAVVVMLCGISLAASAIAAQQATQIKADDDKSKILIDAKVFTIEPNAASLMGFFNSTLKVQMNVDANTGTAGMIKSGELTDEQVKNLEKWLQSQKDVKLLSVPKVLVLDGEQAKMSILTDHKYIKGYKEPNEAGAAPEPIYDTVAAGTIFDVTPTLMPHQQIRLKIKYELTNIIKMEKKVYKPGCEIEIPLIDVLAIESVVVAPADKTVLMPLGGMMKPADSGTMQRQLTYLLVKATVMPENSDPNLSPRGKVISFKF